jgi:glycolate oxidase FAD binding subunit
MCALDSLANALQSVVGAPFLLTDAAAAEYAIDGLPPALVAFPADEAEATAVLRLANEHQATVFPRGSGSYLELGNTPERVEVVLALQRLQRQLAYEPADMTTTVQAGMRLAELQQVLGQHGQCLALDPPAAATATVGGIVATNRSGPRRLLYGTVRDLLLGTAVLSIDGKRTKAGGRVVKNVTGYDLNKLYIGSLGTLAVLVELTFKLHPLPPGEHTVGIGFMHHGDMLPLLQTVMQLPLRLSSLALLNAAASTTIARHVDWSAPDTTYLLLTRLEGPPQVTQNQERRLLEALRRLSLQGTATTYTWNDDAPLRVWHAIAEFPVTVHVAAQCNVVSKVSLLMSDLPAFFQDMHTLSTRVGTAWPVCAQAGSGIAYVGMSPGQHDATNGKTMLEQIQALDACVTRLHGRRVIERAPLEVKRHCDVWGAPGDDLALMRAIKKSFDPHNRLNPGRFLGGL